MKKIIYFVDFPHGYGGASKVLLTQAYIMQRMGYQVRAVIPNDLNGDHAREFDLLCKDYNLDTVTARYPIATCMEEIDMMEALACCGVIKHIIKDFAPDMIHSSQLNIAVELAARELKIPHLMNIYQTDVQSFHIKWMRVYPQYHSADSICFSKRWSEGLGIPSRCIRVAYEQPKDLYANDEKDREETINIVAVGVLCERKKQLEIIKFILLCKKNGYRVRLNILGNYNNAYGKKCKLFVEQNELQNEVVFNGVVLNIEDYYANAELFILSSTVESYPGVIVESMANKVPVLSTAIAGIPELLKDGDNGFLISKSSAEDIYESFLRFLKYRNTGTLYRIVDNAFNTYLKNHTYDAVGKQLNDYYNWIRIDYHSKNTCYLEIEELRKRFEYFIFEKRFDRVNNILIKQLWLLYHITSAIKNKDKKKAVIWGAGFWGSVALDWLQLAGSRVEFAGFIDTKKHGQYLGQSILENKDTVIIECDIIIVALEDEAGRLDIMNYLEGYKKVRNIDYFMVCNGPIRI